MDENKYDPIMEKIGYWFVQSDRTTSPTRDDIAALEKKLGYQLPTDYKEFLLKYGVTARGSNGRWVICNEDNVIICSVDVFYGIAPRSDYNLEDYINFYEPEDLPSYMLPIASSAGGSEILMSLAGKDRGSIYCWHSEDPFPSDATELLAKDFDSFMHKIVARQLH